MKHILALLLCILMFPLSAQEISDLMVNYAKKDASLEEIFEDLESQYGIRFSYATNAIENKMMDADFENAPIQAVLDYLLEEESMEYKIVENNILLRKSEAYKEVEDDNYNKSIHIKGKITNRHADEEVLEYATISISNSSIGTYSDERGRFDIEIPLKYLDENIIIHYLGFADEVYKISELDEEYLMVSMQDGQYSIDEVMIVNKEKPLRIGKVENSIQLNNAQINSSTSGVMGNDIGRQIQLLPGIAAHEDNSAAIKIRGSNSDETLMILDGMPIYNANHYYGVFCGVNTSFIDSVNIFKNTYPLHYGGRTAGLVELFSSQAQPKKSEVQVNVDLLTASAKVRIPLSDRSHLSIAGRSTINEVNNELFNITATPEQDVPEVQSFSQKVADRKNDPSFTFYDINAKYQYRNANNDLFTLNFFRSSDDVENFYNTSIKEKDEKELKINVKDTQSWSNTAASMMLSKNINSKLKWNTTTYITQYRNEEDNDLNLDKKYKQGNPPSPPNNPDSTMLGSNQDNELMDISIDSHLEYYFPSSSLQMGFMATHHDMNFRFEENRNNKLSGKDDFFELAAYAGYNFRLGEKLNINSGIRSTYFTNLKTTTHSPRLLLNYQISNHLSFKSSFSIENQVVRQLLYEYRGEPKELWISANNREIPILRSNNFMLGSTFRIGLFSIDVELYQKDMKGQLEYLLPNAGDASNNPEQLRDYKLFRGNGLVRGVDVIVSSGYRSYDTYVSYTLSRSEQQFKEVFQNAFFASENDRTHQLKWVNSLSTGSFTWGLNGVFVSGRPYTDISNVGQNVDLLELDPKKRLRRVRSYHRIDVSSCYVFDIGKYKASFTASVFNLLNTKNVQYIQSIITQDNTGQNIIVGNESELLNRTFNIGLNVCF